MPTSVVPSSVDTIRLFNVADFGIDAREFVDFINPTFSDLPWDEYDLRRAQLRVIEKHLAEPDPAFSRASDAYYSGSIRTMELSHWIERLPADAKEQFWKAEPFRRRSIATFGAQKAGEKWDVQRIPTPPFRMNVYDHRAIARVFAPMGEPVAAHPDLQILLAGLAEWVGEFRPSLRALRITLHQVSCIARVGRPASNAPEGIHQDGSMFIVSALVISRTAVQGGVSTVYKEDRVTQLKRVCLGAGQGLFHEDSGSPLWHDVSPISVEQGSTVGSRNTLGFDLNVVE